MSVSTKSPSDHVGDWLEVNGLPGCPPRRGQIVEVLGRAGHPHYRVRWDEKHESIVYPADGAAIVRPAATRRASRRI
jgi:hypothetical protein